jgi:hypothetical protein
MTLDPFDQRLYTEAIQSDYGTEVLNRQDFLKDRSRGLSQLYVYIMDLLKEEKAELEKAKASKDTQDYAYYFGRVRLLNDLYSYVSQEAGNAEERQLGSDQNLANLGEK